MIKKLIDPLLFIIIFQSIHLVEESTIFLSKEKRIIQSFLTACSILAPLPFFLYSASRFTQEKRSGIKVGNLKVYLFFTVLTRKRPVSGILEGKDLSRSSARCSARWPNAFWRHETSQKTFTNLKLHNNIFHHRQIKS